MFYFLLVCFTFKCVRAVCCNTIRYYATQVAEFATQFFITDNKCNCAGLVLAGSAEFKNELQVLFFVVFMVSDPRVKRNTLHAWYLVGSDTCSLTSQYLNNECQVPEVCMFILYTRTFTVRP